MDLYGELHKSTSWSIEFIRGYENNMSKLLAPVISYIKNHVIFNLKIPIQISS